jgi:glycosyltransferase involved in cell wall biosynthesis
LQLRLVGRGSESVIRELRQTVTAAGHPGLIDLSGYVERNQLPEYLSRAHVFAAPSAYEGGPGFVYLEAMACGLPVVACDGSGVSEVIEDGVTGFLVPPQSVDALYDALDRLLSQKSLRGETGRRAREYVEREANRDDCLRQIEEFYCEVAHRCHRSPASV